jgi:hypothetical protein
MSVNRLSEPLSTLRSEPPTTADCGFRYIALTSPDPSSAAGQKQTYIASGQGQQSGATYHQPAASSSLPLARPKHAAIASLNALRSARASFIQNAVSGRNVDTQAKPLAAIAPERLWYKDAIIYQLHVKSFFDSNDMLVIFLA